MNSPPSSAIALSFSDVGSSISQRQPQIPVYDQYPSHQRRSRRRRNYMTPSTVSSSYYPYNSSAYSYYPQSYSYASSYDPSSMHTAYSGNQYSSQTAEGMYFSLNGKLVRSYKDRNYRKAQKLVLDLYPDLLQGIASSRIEFYVNRIGLSRGRHVYVKSYISKHAWATEIDALAPHETVVIDVRPSLSLTESLTSFFGGKGFA